MDFSTPSFIKGDEMREIERLQLRIRELEAGMSINDIVAEGRISRSTAYRYKAFYKSTKESEETDGKGNTFQ